LAWLAPGSGRVGVLVLGLAPALVVGKVGAAEVAVAAAVVAAAVVVAVVAAVAGVCTVSCEGPWAGLGLRLPWEVGAKERARARVSVGQAEVTSVRGWLVAGLSCGESSPPPSIWTVRGRVPGPYDTLSAVHVAHPGRWGGVCNWARDGGGGCVGGGG
jgi:hypothetical protein